MRAIRVATRRSALARAQSGEIADRLAASTGRRVELVEVTTQGDTDLASLARIGGTGVFVGAVRRAVLEGRADVAVHSLKDLPTAPEPGLALAAVPPRVDPRDALVSRGATPLAELPPGARVGTGSPRRRAQLLGHRGDLRVVDIRGNVDSRLSRVQSGADPRHGLDAVVLAVAGLSRLGRQASITEILDPDDMVPAPGQGALAVEVRTDLAAADTPDPGLSRALAALDDPRTRASVLAERTFLARLEAGCSAPVGALATVGAEVPEPLVHLRAAAVRADGSLLHVSTTGPVGQAGDVGARLARDVLAELAPSPERGSIR